jgi:hypothetical protein
LSYEDLEVARENCAAKIKRRPVKAMGKLAGSATVVRTSTVRKAAKNPVVT